MKKIIIAIDGFSSCGKSTMARDLAQKIGYLYVDSGAMYRAMTLFCIENNCFEQNVLNEKMLHALIPDIHIHFEQNEVTGRPDTYLNNKNVEHAIRTMEVSNKVSIVSAVGFVRKIMVQQQQEIGVGKGIVMDGRDIGTVVYPQAELKIFVTASPQIRAQRRLDELQSKGDKITSLNDVLDNIKDRDYKDQNRTESPLRKAADAIELDNSQMTVEEQMQWLVQKYNQIIDAT